MATAQVLTVLSLICAIAAAICAWRVNHIDPREEDKIFPAYLISQSIFLVAASITGTDSTPYAWVYLLLYPPTLVLYCLIVRKLYRQVFLKFPGVAMYGQWCIYLAAVVAIVAAFVSREATSGALSSKRSLLIGVEFAGENLVFGLAILIVFLVLLLARYPIELRQNIVVNCGCFSLVLLAEAGANLANHLTGLKHTAMLDELSTVLNIGSFGLWASLLSRDGETRTVIPHSGTPEAEQRLLAELNSLNAILLRAARK